MSDFFSDSWSWFVTIATILSIIACLILLMVVALKKVKITADNTTGHVWDEDLVELNNPMPKWWMWLFVITIIFAAVYLVLFPGLGSYKGSMGWSSVGSYNKEVKDANLQVAQVYEQFKGKTVQQLAADPNATGIATRLFLNNCAQCHGSDGRGSKGFPNLTDSDWLWGGTPERIHESISAGRQGMMPAMAAAVGGAEDVRNLSEYVMTLSGSPADSVRAGLGKSKFTACIGCHGTNGKGNPVLGAPNLTDDVWLHGWGAELVADMINKGKSNAMPAQKDRLSEDQIRLLTAYVWGLSNAAPSGSQ